MTFVAQILTFVLITQAIQEIISMKEPAVTTYENFLDVDTREEIGAISLKDSGTIIAIELTHWDISDEGNLNDEETREHFIGIPMPSKYGRVAAY